jgi:hypothetical protein
MCVTIHNSKHFLFSDDLKICRINNVDCKVSQFDIDSVQNWCFENGMILNVGKTTAVSFTCKTVSIHFNYKLRNNFIYFSSVLKILELHLAVSSIFIVTYFLKT